MLCRYTARAAPATFGAVSTPLGARASIHATTRLRFRFVRFDSPTSLPKDSTLKSTIRRFLLGEESTVKEKATVQEKSTVQEEANVQEESTVKEQSTVKEGSSYRKKRAFKKVPVKAETLLWPPWQVSDLSKTEQDFLNIHGEDYIMILKDRRDKREYREAIRNVEVRQRVENYQREKFGVHWYEIRQAARARFIALEKKTRDDSYRRLQEIDARLQSMDKDSPIFRDLQFQRRQASGALNEWVASRDKIKREIHQEVANTWGLDLTDALHEHRESSSPRASSTFTWLQKHVFKES